MNQHNVTSEICLTVPEGLPHYLPNAGESSIYTDFENKRIGLFVSFIFILFLFLFYFILFYF